MDDVQETVHDTLPTSLLVGVRLFSTGRMTEYDVGRLSLRAGDNVLVPAEGGAAVGTVVTAPRARQPLSTRAVAPRVIKKADSRDLARTDGQMQRAQDALRACFALVQEQRLPMKLIKADSRVDGAKTTIYFAAEGRVDFRQLVRDLAYRLHTRIELKQIGARDEAANIGAMGPCDRELCCSSFLRSFNPVSVKMARAQGLSLNPSKLAGMCGRLKCCLRYEYDTYVELGRALPAMGKRVVSVKGDGVVVRQHVLRQTVVLKRDDGVEVEATLEDMVEKKNQDEAASNAGGAEPSD